MFSAAPPAGRTGTKRCLNCHSDTDLDANQLFFFSSLSLQKCWKFPPNREIFLPLAHCQGGRSLCRQFFCFFFLENVPATYGAFFSGNYTVSIEENKRTRDGWTNVTHEKGADEQKKGLTPHRQGGSGPKMKERKKSIFPRQRDTFLLNDQSNTHSIAATMQGQSRSGYLDIGFRRGDLGLWNRMGRRSMAKFLRFRPIRSLLMIGSVRHVCTQPREERRQSTFTKLWNCRPGEKRGENESEFLGSSSFPSPRCFHARDFAAEFPTVH